MVTAILVGIASSLATEVVTWLNKKFTGTVLQGEGAFVLAFGISFVISLVIAIMQPGFQLEVSWPALVSFFSIVFTSSQVWFMVITQRLGLVVKVPTIPAPQVDPAPVAPQAAPQPAPQPIVVPTPPDASVEG